MRSEDLQTVAFALSEMIKMMGELGDQVEVDTVQVILIPLSFNGVGQLKMFCVCTAMTHSSQDFCRVSTHLPAKRLLGRDYCHL